MIKRPKIIKEVPVIFVWIIMSIKINDLQLNMKNAINLFVKMTSFLITTQMGTQISYF